MSAAVFALYSAASAMIKLNEGRCTRQGVVMVIEWHDHAGVVRSWHMVTWSCRAPLSCRRFGSARDRRTRCAAAAAEFEKRQSKVTQRSEGVLHGGARSTVHVVFAVASGDIMHAVLTNETQCSSSTETAHLHAISSPAYGAAWRAMCIASAQLQSNRVCVYEFVCGPMLRGVFRCAAAQ